MLKIIGRPSEDGVHAPQTANNNHNRSEDQKRTTATHTLPSHPYQHYTDDFRKRFLFNIRMNNVALIRNVLSYTPLSGESAPTILGIEHLNLAKRNQLRNQNKSFLAPTSFDHHFFHDLLTFRCPMPCDDDSFQKSKWRYHERLKGDSTEGYDAHFWEAEKPAAALRCALTHHRPNRGHILPISPEIVQLLVRLALYSNCEECLNTVYYATQYDRTATVSFYERVYRKMGHCDEIMMMHSQVKPQRNEHHNETEVDNYCGAALAALTEGAFLFQQDATIPQPTTNRSRSHREKYVYSRQTLLFAVPNFHTDIMFVKAFLLINDNHNSRNANAENEDDVIVHFRRRILSELFSHASLHDKSECGVLSSMSRLECDKLKFYLDAFSDAMAPRRVKSIELDCGKDHLRSAVPVLRPLFCPPPSSRPFGVVWGSGSGGGDALDRLLMLVCGSSFQCLRRPQLLLNYGASTVWSSYMSIEFTKEALSDSVIRITRHQLPSLCNAVAHPCVALLLDAGADPNGVTAHGCENYSVILCEQTHVFGDKPSNQHHHVFKIEVVNEATPPSFNVTQFSTRPTLSCPLIERSSHYGSQEAIGYLVNDGGADILVRDENDVTALHCATMRGYKQYVRLLLRASGFKLAEAKENKSSLISDEKEATINRIRQQLEYLCEHQDIIRTRRCPDAQPSSPSIASLPYGHELHHSLSTPNCPICSTILSPNKQGTTPLKLAQTFERRDVTELFVEAIYDYRETVISTNQGSVNFCKILLLIDDL